MDELISKQAAIEAINVWLYCDKDERMPADVIKALPSVQPTITHEQAIDYLHKTGWLQNHDRILTESKIVPSAQPDVPDTNVGDMISRKVAMERLMVQNVIMDGSEYHNGFNAGVNRAQEVIKNLPPVQPKQTNCEYCHTDRDGYVFPLEKNSHAFIDRDKIVLKAKGWRGEAKIKYCPICGRRLTDG